MLFFNLSHVHLLFLILIVLLIISSFFSGSETAMMAINRYRLRHLASKHHPAATRVNRLLERPDQLLGVVLIGNTFTNMIISAVASLIAIDLFGPLSVLPVSIVMALIVLIFAEVIPKTWAALRPESLAFPASKILSLLLIVLYPLVWCANAISNGFLRLFNLKVKGKNLDHLTGDEVRTIVHEATNQLTMSSKHMMLGVLDLSAITVDDVSVPRSDIVGIDLDDTWPEILKQLAASEHTRLPVYNTSIDQVLGMLHVRKALNLATQNLLNKDSLKNNLQDVYFIPEGTPLNVQLLNFRQVKRRIGLIVDEYGDIQGLITLDDILEEIVGEYTTNLAASDKNVQRQPDGSFLVDGSASIRELNRRFNWLLPMEGPKTLSGLIIEFLEMIPVSPMCLRIDGYPCEVLEVEENMVKVVRIWPELRVEL